MSTDTKNVDQSFGNEDSWAIQCLTLAALGMLAYLHIADTIVMSV